MNIVSFFFTILYTVVVVGICACLLSRGLTQSFVLWFGGGAVLQAIPSVGFHFLELLPGGISANLRWTPALSAAGTLGALFSLVGFITLAAFLLRIRPAEMPNR